MSRDAVDGKAKTNHMLGTKRNFWQRHSIVTLQPVRNWKQHIIITILLKIHKIFVEATWLYVQVHSFSILRNTQWQLSKVSWRASGRLYNEGCTMKTDPLHHTRASPRFQSILEVSFFLLTEQKVIIMNYMNEIL